MTLRVNEIFYSLQGEGHFTGAPAVFLRLSGCNLRCPFCDTDHSGYTVMEYEEVLDRLNVFPSRHIVITGGEPALQLTPEFLAMLHDAGWFVQVETNGSLPLPDGVDWITCSPKNVPIVYSEVSELKVLFDGREDDFYFERFDCVRAQDYRLQPCDVGDARRNSEILADCIEYVKAHPRWRLSLQTHKLINIH